MGIHDQWVYGGRTIKYGSILVNYLIDTDWNNMSISTLDEYIKSILTIRWHHPNGDESLKGIRFYPHLIHLIDEAPDEADSNHGCFIIFIKIKGEYGKRELASLETGFFDRDGSFISAQQQNNKYPAAKSLSDKEVAKMDFFDRLTETDYKNLCEEIRERRKIT